MTASKPAIGVLGVFRVRGDVFMDGLLKVLHWVQAAKGINPERRSDPLAALRSWTSAASFKIAGL